ncbi:MAG: hypothetical protein A2747_02745 [Candidatus Yonathbacteria bacterium RIFCSPHIGHO2_01_FULL_44_41]|uniref:Vitamin K epoxide reductase domain-containing protein n=1 Tax=Candidatus Yonathbacteria bacterium RIFCSPHIGHO2_02_FULL_44_14 TaxID=1802724 RepID=A0A1G2S8G9_9BACT|nr:MAG: hypothetical protein A2747_02745 [Candidatus Yonathbacteria bacterium RIFCSPHIGHO2_01_FULL_44_41]OHA80571.1 MAG: hypothetical protein A3D51_00645 [Candidatus Yonathbacteria bacterium RIFCSPHIGHO2_02_FULL_44_14]OHA82137.1 MAG: hypothetical protein A3B06_01350 [Candidatus Yonathbacteria bacterium RIFCSPLOWO2_01_FULL_43_20]
MKTKMYWIQTATLLGGTVFAWTTALVDFMRFYNAEGTLLKIKDCIYPNPVTTPCFYGAIAFAVAFAWSVALLKKEGEMRRKSEKYLLVLLSAGNVFAWTNFLRLVYDFYTALPGQGVGCSGVPTASPFTTPCFYGSAIFFVALLIALIILKRESEPRSPETK